MCRRGPAGRVLREWHSYWREIHRKIWDDRATLLRFTAKPIIEHMIAPDGDGILQTPKNTSGADDYLALVKLTPLLGRTRGRLEIKIGLIDGPIILDHPDLATENIRGLPGVSPGACALSTSAACDIN